MTWCKVGEDEIRAGSWWCYELCDKKKNCNKRKTVVWEPDAKEE